jgi:cysteine synthase B
MNLLEMVGNTPLVALKNISKPLGKTVIYAKAEFMNPSGSVKDRAAKAMLLDGMEKGLLHKGKAIIDATSGNTGIAFALFGASLGMPVVLFMPENAGEARKRIMKSYGARIVETDPLSGSDGAFLAVREEVARDPGKWFYPDQYNNPANWMAHYNGTGREIWLQTEGKATHFVSVLGTSGTFTGTSRRLMLENPALKAVAVEPSSPLHGIEGAKHMASTIRPGILDEALAGNPMRIDTESAFRMARRLAREEGIYAGISSGANVAAALEAAKEAPDGSTVVTVLCDSGSRYTFDSFWLGDKEEKEVS